jgi:pilus assembly protein Flp/PilA
LAEGVAMKLLLTRFVKEERGSTALEYGLIAAGLSIAIVTVLTQVGFTLVRLKAASAVAGN